MMKADSKAESGIIVDHETTNDSVESSTTDKKRKFDEVEADADSATVMPTDVLIKTPHFITSEYSLSVIN
jgi:hypothetical protein